MSGWEMLPPREEWSSDEWAIWEQLQTNGAAGYEADPERNLGVGERDDCLAFSRFSRLNGDVLDVGCGPQRWPSYFAVREPGTRMVGVDPLVGAREAAYTQFRALAEHLPFRDGAFDRVLFATTLDHFVDVRAALCEAERVLAPDGRVMAWVGHKSPDAPAPETSPEWYTSLDVPEGAEDLFHVKRLTPEDALGLFDNSGFDVADSSFEQLDSHRSNHFFELVPRER
jgi:SAM-dependent methyltransferase